MTQDPKKTVVTNLNFKANPTRLEGHPDQIIAWAGFTISPSSPLVIQNCAIISNLSGEIRLVWPRRRRKDGQGFSYHVAPVDQQTSNQVSKLVLDEFEKWHGGGKA